MQIEIKARLDKAVNASKPEEQLIKLVEELKQDGWSQLEVYDVFKNYLDLLWKVDSDAPEVDAVMDVLDYIYGLCVESAKLFPHTLSNEEIERYQVSKQPNQL